jgi:prevent-host-death family protein
MKVYTYSEARQRLADVLNTAKNEEVVIKRRGGETFSIIFKKSTKSPFDVPGIKTKATTKDILEAVRESRERFGEQSNEDERAV